METVKKPVVRSLLLVAAVAVTVFATSTITIQAASDVTDAQLADAKPFRSLQTVGAVAERVNANQRTFYRMDFRAIFGGEPIASSGAIPDIVIRQVAVYPALSDEPQFVGPAALPFRSQELALRVDLSGKCFHEVKTGFRLRGKPGECARALLALDGKAFDVTDLFRSLSAFIAPNGPNEPDGRLFVTATFNDPGYGFPIASLGERSQTTLIIGDMGGRTTVRRVVFSG